MALADIKIQREEIKVGDASFTIKGLSLTDITVLVRQHLADFEAIYEIGTSAVAGRANLGEDDIVSICMSVCEQAPGFAANLIALAAEDTSKEALDVAYKLPFPVQIGALVKIVNLTFDEVGGVKKGVEAVINLMKGNKDTLAQMTASLQQ